MISINICNNNYNKLKKNNILKEIKDPKIYFKYFFSLKCNGSEYIFKEEEIRNIINELVVIEICKLFDIDVVEQKLAILKLEDTLYYGLWSKNFKEKEYNYIFMAEILNDYFLYLSNVANEYLDLMHYNLNNLEFIWQVLEYKYKYYPNYEKQIELFMNKLVDIFLLDVLIGQIDRHGFNIEIKDNNDIFSLTKLYDNTFAFDYTNLSLGVTCDSFDNNNFISLITEFLDISSYEYILRFKNMLETLTINKFEEIVNDIKNNNDLIDEEHYKYLIEKYTEYHNKYTKILKKRLK